MGSPGQGSKFLMLKMARYLMRKVRLGSSRIILKTERIKRFKRYQGLSRKMENGITTNMSPRLFLPSPPRHQNLLLEINPRWVAMILVLAGVKKNIKNAVANKIS
jgi:hypothetical protein